MPMPSIRSIQEALLEFANSRTRWHKYDSIPFLVERFRISDEEQQYRIVDGRSVLRVRIDAALVRLKKAQQLENPAQGYYQVTEHIGDLLPRVVDNDGGVAQSCPRRAPVTPPTKKVHGALSSRLA